MLGKYDTHYPLLRRKKIKEGSYYQVAQSDGQGTGNLEYPFWVGFCTPLSMIKITII